MASAFTSEHELTQDLLELAGYRVSEDVDQPGMFVWTRQEGGKTVAGCDSSLDTEQETWDEVRWIVGEVLRDEGGLDAEEWKALSAQERQRAIVEQFGSPQEWASLQQDS